MEILLLLLILVTNNRNINTKYNTEFYLSKEFKNRNWNKTNQKKEWK
jgi:hypothetical protein